MPVVFVHGVSTRASPVQQVGIAFRDALTRRYLLPPLGLNPTTVTLFNPYWGKYAARFRWNNGSLPSEGAEPFGPGDTLSALLLAEQATVVSAPDRVVLETARRSMDDAIDLVWATAGELIYDQAEAEALAALAARATAFARQSESVGWLQDARDDEDFLYRLSTELDHAEVGSGGQSHEAFGSEKTWDRLQEALGRIRDVAGQVVGRVAVSTLRSSLHLSASTLLGDVLVYLNERGEHGNEGPIVSVIASDLEKASKQRNDADSRLIIIAHSMGGNIVYDILSYFRPDLVVDTLVTVGSQVGVFEELGLFRSSQPNFPMSPLTDRVPPLPNVGRWINVFDTNDVLGFATARIFADVRDYAYSTGKGILKAHSAYFTRPSFYDRLATRLDALGQ